MANINLAQNTYAGILYAEYLTPAILAPKGLVDRGLVTGIESVKNKVTLRGVNRVIDFQTPAATFNAQSGDVSLDEKQLTMVPYEVMDQIDAELLRTTWESEQQGRGSFEDYKLTPELYNFLLERIYVPRMAIGNEQLYILGKAGVNAGEVATASFSATYAGLLPTIAADAGVRKLQLPESAKEAITAIANGAAGAATITIGSTNDVQVGDEITVIGANGSQTSGGVTINGQTFVVLAKNAGVLTVDKIIEGVTPATSGSLFFVNPSNVLEVLQFVYMSIPQKIKKQISNTGNGRTKIHCSSRIIDAYRVANGLVQGSGGRFTLDGYFAQDALIPFLDIDLVEMPYWSPNTLVVWNPGNVFLGYDLLSDEVFARVLYLGDVTGDDVYRIKNRMKSAIDYKFAAEVFMYRPQ
jgi:hypothetical protein